jgi:phosphate transport system substrate-binding protein
MQRRRRVHPALPVLALLAIACAGPRDAAPGASAGAQRVITNIGSDTMVNLALAWAEAYAAVRPEVRLSVTGGGTGTGITALINGTADIANASREMKKEELADARAKGVEPKEHVVARDAIAVIVHKNNPVSRLTVGQLSDIYAGRISNWREVGGEDRPIVRLSRETNSGTHVYFLEAVVRRGDKKNKTLLSTDTLLLPSSEGVTAEVVQNPNAIGYEGLGYVTEEMKVVAVSKGDDGPYVMPSADTVDDGSYPIARDLYFYTRGEPQGALGDYIRWVTGGDAQRIVRQLGFVPVN